MVPNMELQTLPVFINFIGQKYGEIKKNQNGIINHNKTTSGSEDKHRLLASLKTNEYRTCNLGAFTVAVVVCC